MHSNDNWNAYGSWCNRSTLATARRYIYSTLSYHYQTHPDNYVTWGVGNHAANLLWVAFRQLVTRGILQVQNNVYVPKKLDVALLA